MLAEDARIIEGQPELDSGMVEAGQAEKDHAQIGGETIAALSVDDFHHVLL